MLNRNKKDMYLNTGIHTYQCTHINKPLQTTSVKEKQSKSKKKSINFDCYDNSYNSSNKDNNSNMSNYIYKNLAPTKF